MFRTLLILALISSQIVFSCKSTTDKTDTAESTETTIEVKDEPSDDTPAINVVMVADVFEKQISNYTASGKEFQLIDVRSPAEILETGKIEGAINLDWNDGRFEAEYGNLNRDQPTLLYCRSGNRSGKARNLLIENGYKEVYDLEGGITAWLEKGKAVIKKGQ